MQARCSVSWSPEVVRSQLGIPPFISDHPSAMIAPSDMHRLMLDMYARRRVGTNPSPEASEYYIGMLRWSKRKPITSAHIRVGFSRMTIRASWSLKPRLS